MHDGLIHSQQRIYDSDHIHCFHLAINVGDLGVRPCQNRSFADQSEGGCSYSIFEKGVTIVNGGVYATASKFKPQNFDQKRPRNLEILLLSHSYTTHT